MTQQLMQRAFSSTLLLLILLTERTCGWTNHHPRCDHRHVQHFSSLYVHDDIHVNHDDDMDPPPPTTITKSTAPSRPSQPPLQRRVQNLDAQGNLRRKPRGYWKDLENIRKELHLQWQDAIGAAAAAPAAHAAAERGDDEDNDEEHSPPTIPDPPPIPNETLLTFWKRHDLRGAIRQYGREELSIDLGGAVMVPGKWREAIHQVPLVRRVIQNDPRLSLEYPPTSSQHLARLKYQYNIENVEEWQRSGRWKYKNKSTRNDYGFWDESTVMTKFYEYLQLRHRDHNMPMIWMPRLSELDMDLRLALIKTIDNNNVNGGGDDTDDQQVLLGFNDDCSTASDKICRHAGLIPYREWHYFERQLDLMVSLKEYLDEHCDGDYTVFPPYTTFPLKGYDRLFRLIQDFGGRRFVAGRLGLRYRQNTFTARQRQIANRGYQAVNGSYDTVDAMGDLNWGKFDLQFGILLLGTVREEQMRLRPPLRRQQRSISMLSPTQILAKGERGRYLHAKMEAFGGYESVARRLGLDYFGR